MSDKKLEDTPVAEILDTIERYARVTQKATCCYKKVHPDGPCDCKVIDLHGNFMDPDKQTSGTGVRLGSEATGCVEARWTIGLVHALRSKVVDKDRLRKWFATMRDEMQYVSDNEGTKALDKACTELEDIIAEGDPPKQYAPVKVLCLCQGGFTRSVALKRAISKEWNADVMTAGVSHNGSPVLDYLFGWAEVVFVVDEFLQRDVDWRPTEAKAKTFLIPIGPDIFSGPDDHQLKAKIDRLMPEIQEHMEKTIASRS